ncbi:MAG: protein translocase subunit SecD [Candidatus Woesearchaeota archaeon]
MKIKKLFSIRVIILLFVLLLCLIAINPNPYASGLEVKNVGGEAASQGIKHGDVVESINGETIESIEEFNSVIGSIGVNSTFIFRSSGGEVAYITTQKPEITVQIVRTNNIQKGLDLSGGTRVLLRPDVERTVSDQEITNLIDVLNNRLNTYGLSDLQIRSAKDREGTKLVLIEIAGASRQEVKELIEQQGEFEAKIGNDTVFVGSEKDITFVCKDDGTCSGIRNCDESANGAFCTFEFQISLSGDAAKRHAEITKDIPIGAEEDGGRVYLELPLDLYLDGQLVSSLQISEGLKGLETTAILISGPGNGATQEAAYDDALKEMNRLQTVLITGSLPFGLEIEKLDSISPLLGGNFVKNAFFVGFLALITVSIITFIRFRKLKIVLPMMFTMASEVFIILGVAAFIGWRLDLVSIAGIIAAVGTGVDDQIVITDEVLRGQERAYNWKQRIKRAFFIIFAAYATTFVALLPLWNAGAGLVRGFAITTLIGITVGVLITRPAFASIVEKLLSD